MRERGLGSSFVPRVSGGVVQGVIAPSTFRANPPDRTVPDEAAEPVTYPRDAGQHLADLYRRERLAAFGGCFVHEAVDPAHLHNI